VLFSDWVFARVGHRIELRATPQIVLACAIRHWVPERTRLADQLVGAAKRAMG
jgi:deoxyinosine 3'endonuclease (endonuclease V)